MVASITTRRSVDRKQEQPPDLLQLPSRASVSGAMVGMGGRWSGGLMPGLGATPKSGGGQVEVDGIGVL